MTPTRDDLKELLICSIDESRRESTRLQNTNLDLFVDDLAEDFPMFTREQIHRLCDLSPGVRIHLISHRNDSSKPNRLSTRFPVPVKSLSEVRRHFCTGGIQLDDPTEHLGYIKLINEWLLVSNSGIPLTLTTFDWRTLVKLLKRHQYRNCKAVHDRVGVVIPRGKAISLGGIPTHIELPYCVKCGNLMRLANGKNHLFLGCSRWPDCYSATSLVKMIRTEMPRRSASPFERSEAKVRQAFQPGKADLRHFSRTLFDKNQVSKAFLNPDKKKMPECVEESLLGPLATRHYRENEPAIERCNYQFLLDVIDRIVFPGVAGTAPRASRKRRLELWRQALNSCANGADAVYEAIVHIDPSINREPERSKILTAIIEWMTKDGEK